ncbi:MAG: hypothetical protein Q9213_003183 [Squamulea squamosa]
MSWVSPFAPSDSSAWPDSPSKTWWIGPFDLDKYRYAKVASQTTSPEAPELQRLRRLADAQYTEGNYIGARFSLAQIVEQYISDLQHTSVHTGDFNEYWKKRNTLDHRIRTTIGGIINSYFRQCPELSDDLRYQKDEPFYDAVEKERNFEDPRVLYTIRVILYYAATVLYQPDAEWIWKSYRQALICTEPVFGSQHPDIIHLLQGSAQAIEKREMNVYWKHLYKERPQEKKEAEKHKLQSMARWKGEVQALLSRALSGLRKLHGYTAQPTLDCAYDIAAFHRRCGEADAAESTLREMCELTKKDLGEEHDETLRFKAELSSLLLEQNWSVDAGLNIHRYISEHWEAIQNASLWPWGLGSLEKHTDKRGWGAMIELLNNLSRHQAPFHFTWADHNLYTLPIRNVKLFPIFPFEDQKNCAWSFNCGTSEGESDLQTFTSDVEAKALVFQSSVNSDLSVDVRVPYIPYSHFMGTMSFEKGEPYLEYVKAAEDIEVSRLIHEEAEANTPIKISNFMEVTESDSVEKNKKVTNVEECVNLNFGSYGHVSKVQGFFNCVPTDSSLLIGETLPQLNLVSSKWADWKHFTLHPPPNNTPSLELVDGTEIRCYGYISGTWTDINLQLQRKIFKLFVVDAVFSAADATCLFALPAADALESPQYHERE